MNDAIYITAAVISTLLTQIKSTNGEESIGINGGGASFPAEVYLRWQSSFSAERRDYVLLNMTYEPVGSGEGKTSILNNDNGYMYAGSDVDFSTTEKEHVKDLVIFPSLAGAIVIAYNIPGLPSSQQLNLGSHQLVGIFNGTIKWWNDTSLSAANPNVPLPIARILPVVRADKSGTTKALTKALSYFSTQWNQTYGTFENGLNPKTWLPYHWRNDTIMYYGKKTSGMAGILTSIRYTIGYLSAADIAGNADIGRARIENRDGHFVDSTLQNVINAMNQQRDRMKSSSSFVTDLFSARGANSYPLSSFSYFIIHSHHNDNCDATIELIRYIEWFLYETEARDICSLYQMVSISKLLADEIRDTILKTMKCGSKSNEDAYQLMLKAKETEAIVPKTWLLPVAITLPIALVLIGFLVGYLFYQKYKLWKMINSNEWDIPLDDILFFYNQRKMGSTSRSLFGKSRVSFTSLTSEDLTALDDNDALVSQIIQWPGKWKGHTIGIRLMNISDMNDLSQSTKRMLLWIRDNIIHQNVLRFHGLTLVDADRYVVSEYCAKGPMLDILQDEKFTLNNDIKFSLATDIVAGMCYLHSHGVVHGNLKSSCCIIDSRWTVKITDWEYVHLYETLKQKKSPLLAIRPNADDVGKQQAAFREFWTAPEILRANFDIDVSQSCDIYSFAIILQEIFSREDPYAEHADVMNPDDVLKAVVNNCLRPEHTDESPVRIRQIMEIAWADDSSTRPSFEQIAKMLKHANPTKKNMLDSMMEAMEEYTIQLEEKVEERTSELTSAKANMEQLLFANVPNFVAQKLVNNESVPPQEHKSVALLVVELNNLAAACQENKPDKNMQLLSELHRDIDVIVGKRRDIYKVQLFGDTVICVSGLTKKFGKKHVLRMAALALELVNLAISKYQPEESTDSLKNIICRCGLHCGPVQSGVLGNSAGNYVIFGDAINAAITLMYSSCAMKIQISEHCYKVLQNTGMFQMEKAAVITLKDRSTMQTYWLLGKEGVKYGIPDTDQESDSKSTSTKNGIPPVSVV
ncbi:atrial natriuretic peptide receptor 1-like [Lineus longissimus]|uniref:atrial natriuretic peptide receptor 1-like n=1 Tax=Lineus longissimus TaxID=88925 RepID=UPI002B4CF339